MQTHAHAALQVRRVSARLLKLQSLFGDDSRVDIAAMLIREPRSANRIVPVTASCPSMNYLPGMEIHVCMVQGM